MLSLRVLLISKYRRVSICSKLLGHLFSKSDLRGHAFLLKLIWLQTKKQTASTTLCEQNLSINLRLQTVKSLKRGWKSWVQILREELKTAYLFPDCYESESQRISYSHFQYKKCFYYSLGYLGVVPNT